jgi:putative hydrolase of the HAD superfamily
MVRPSGHARQIKHSDMIKNVVFDIGNVFVHWSPPEVIRRCFGHAPDTAENRERTALLRSPLWLRLNRGELTGAEAELAYQAEHGLTRQQAADLLFHVKDHQELVDGTEAIARRLQAAGYRLFALTDNVREIVTHLKTRFQFWELFDGAVVSAEIGMLKPHDGIFHHLVDSFGLAPSETVFFDDVQANVDGARRIGLQARLFTTSGRCEQDLRALGLRF